MITFTVRGCIWEPEEEVDEEDWPGGLGSEVAGDGESTPVCFWLRGTEADWEIHESGGKEISQISRCLILSNPFYIFPSINLASTCPLL